MVKYSYVSIITYDTIREVHGFNRKLELLPISLRFEVLD